MPLRNPLACLLCALCVVISAAACPQSGLSDAKEAARAPAAAASELVLRAGKLFLESAGKSVEIGGFAKPLPYAIIPSPSVPLVTALYSDLTPVTFAAAGEVQVYKDMLPLLADGPLIALGSENVDPDYRGRLILLTPDGTPGWQAEAAELLWSPVGATTGTAYVSIAGADASSMYELGIQPAVAAVDCRSFTELWRIRPGGKQLTAGVELHALNSTAGLLSLQYDYAMYEFVLFDLKDGHSIGGRGLDGQPVARTIYPGPHFETAGAAADAGSLSVLLFFESHAPQRWTFDCSNGTIQIKAEEPPRTLRTEENTHKPGSSPAAPPFNTAILPTVAADNWRIPALLDSSGRVLLVSEAGARWVAVKP